MQAGNHQEYTEHNLNATAIKNGRVIDRLEGNIDSEAAGLKGSGC